MGAALCVMLWNVWFTVSLGFPTCQWPLAAHWVVPEDRPLVLVKKLFPLNKGLLCSTAGFQLLLWHIFRWNDVGSFEESFHIPKLFWAQKAEGLLVLWLLPAWPQPLVQYWYLLVKDVGWNIIREFWGMLKLLGAWQNRTEQLLGSAVHWWQAALSGTAAPSLAGCHVRVGIFEGSSLFHPLPSASTVAIVNSWCVWITAEDKVGSRNNTQRGLGKDLTPVWDWPAGPGVSVLPYLLCHRHRGPGPWHTSQDVGSVLLWLQAGAAEALH